MKSTNQRGFTILELTIASSVFSLVLLIALTGFLQIGRIFYKGISVAQTQNTAAQILNDVTESLQDSTTISTPQTRGDLKYFCLGQIRYTYTIGTKVDAANTTEFSNGNSVGLIRDILPGSSCSPPCPSSSCVAGETPWQNPVEMLGDRMQLEAFSVVQNLAVSEDYYNVKVVVFYGDDQDLHYADSADRSTVTCTGSSSTQQFCAVGKYTTSVFKGRTT